MSLHDRVENTGRRLLAVAGIVSALTLARAARADLLELTNGDHYRGTVLSMNATNMEFVSEIQGRVILPRSKIAQITFREVTARPMAARPAASVNEPLILSGPSSPATQSAPFAYAPTAYPQVPSAPAASAPAPAAPMSGSTSAVVAQMRQQGIDPKLIDQVQDKILGKSSPEAAAKFNELMGGLMSGQISVKDIQAQAQRAIAEIQEAKKQLGPEAGEMFDSYLGILQKFVQDAAADSTPPVSQTPAAPTK